MDSRLRGNDEARFSRVIIPSMFGLSPSPKPQKTPPSNKESGVFSNPLKQTGVIDA